MSATKRNEILFRKAVEREISGKQSKVFVDVGSGDGVYSKRLGKLAGAKRIVCLDHDESMLAKASSIGCESVVCDLNDGIPLIEESVDLIIVNQVIEHVAKTDVMVREIYRVLSRGGEAVVCTPNLSSWHNVFALAIGWQPYSMQVSDDYYLGNPAHPGYMSGIDAEQAHLRVFTQRALSELMMTHGFDEVISKGVGYYPFGGWVARMLAAFDWRHSAYILLVARKLS